MTIDWPLALAIGVPALGLLAGVVAWRLLRRRGPAPIVRPGVLHELLLAAPIRIWGLLLAGPAVTALALLFAWWIRYWAGADVGQRLEYIGWGFYLAMGAMILVIVLVGGRAVYAETRLGKVSISGEDDDPPPAEPTP